MVLAIVISHNSLLLTAEHFCRSIANITTQPFNVLYYIILQISHLPFQLMKCVRNYLDFVILEPDYNG